MAPSKPSNVQKLKPSLYEAKETGEKPAGSNTPQGDTSQGGTLQDNTPQELTPESPKGGPIQEKWRRPTPFALLLPRI